MSNLYQDAILDAKALRASAMANAKAALEEAFEPKIQEMISKHLSEEEAADMEEEYGAKEEGEDVEGAKMEGQDADIKEEELDEILNQLEEMSSKEDEKTLKEAEEGDDEAKEGDEEEEKEEGEEEEQEEEEEGGGDEAVETEDEVGDETKIVDITLGDLKQVIQSLMAGQEEMPVGEEEPTPDSEDGGAAGDEATAGDEDTSNEEEVSLDEILDELQAEGLPADSGASDVGEYDANDPQSTDLQGDETFERGQADRNGKAMKMEGKKHGKKEEGKMAKELKEARATINTLRKDLQEVNLLNAKYLYMNKLFKAKPLSESQKLKVINTLDRATTVKEVKRAFEIMNESLSARKSQLKESVGFASKPAGVAPKANIVESEQFINRWQKLAGIK